ncbi:PVC-type heme-binding CxxCH protein [Bythopirellula goksoeyrii]|uniref:Cytochrome c n=1 Tax=Bythopirellula goksoeyrii TaxID=1400387 RepID=A0A5B9QA58_9BACT|nr:PVC-type heme-binding CxxCH protein [Bythopirellula goksoeyrii]QEG34629.1 Cytochrome c [Bythopirellula goksoeyrii]
MRHLFCYFVFIFGIGLLCYSFVDAQSPKEAGASREPTQATAGLDVADGLACTLFAAEPMVVNPSAIDVDHKGRVWACEIVNYRKSLGSRPAGDRIVILEDLNGDGQADQSKTFYQGADIDSPHGICVLGTPDGHGTRAIVSTGSRVVILIDDDGDDRCDRQEELFTGIQGKQHDHGIHAFVFGPDGKLYFNIGNSGKEICDARGQPIRDLAGNVVNDRRTPYQEGMAFRCNLDGNDFETLAWNFRNPWMLTVDSFGNIWQSDNDDDGNRGTRVNFVMEFGNYGYKDELTGASWWMPRTGQDDELPGKHWHVNDPGVVPSMLYTGSGSPAGITIYEGKLLPVNFHGQLLHCEPGHNVVRSYRVEEEGAGFSAEITEILKGERDPWFRPVDVKVAPDGSLFVADWYDPGVGGHNVEDLQKGRIFRITPFGSGNNYEVPTYDFATPVGTIAALENPNFAVRAIAWQQILKWGEQAEPEIAKLWESGDPLLQARALWLLGAVASDLSGYVDSALNSDDSRIRIVGLRLARQHQMDMLPLVRRLMHDPSPQVQRELAIALANNNSKEAAQLWAQLADKTEENDRWWLEAIGIAARGKWDSCLEAWIKRVGDKWQYPPSTDIVWISRSKATPARLAELILSANENGFDLDRYLRAFDFQSEPGKSIALTQLLERNYSLPPSVVVEILDRLPKFDITKSPHTKGAVKAYLDSQRGTDQYFQLIRRYQLREYQDDLLAQIISPEDDQTSVEAARTILATGGKDQLLQITSSLDDTHAAALITIGQVDDSDLNLRLLDIVRDESSTMPQRMAAVQGLTKSISGQRLLIQQAKDGKLPEQFQFVAADALHLSSNEEIRQQAEKFLPLPQSANAEALPPLRHLLRETGFADQGQKIFAEVGTCADCHQVHGKGKQVGPDLSEIGSKLSKEAMYQAIMDPSAGISHNYEQYIVILDSGKSMTGLLVSETDEAVTLRNAEGIDTTVSQDEIEDMFKSEISLMPAELQRKLTKQQLVDLVEYLMTLKKP